MFLYLGEEQINPQSEQRLAGLTLWGHLAFFFFLKRDSVFLSCEQSSYVHSSSQKGNGTSIFHSKAVVF